MILTFLPVDQFDSVEIGNINIQMQDLSRRNTNEMDVEADSKVKAKQDQFEALSTTDVSRAQSPILI